MDERQAISAFGSLAQETRLRVLRLLVQAGPQGVPAGRIGEGLEVPPATPLVSSEGAQSRGAGVLASGRALHLLRRRL